jgi:peptidyl-prolyl cis-trans isomerase A (cyclophilin A)
MRRLLVALLTSTLAISLAAQTSGPKGAQAKKPATKAAPVTSATAEPKAIFNTTAGTITCTLFPDKAPITVDNFIGLATGKKEWKNPASGVMKKNTPFYNGTVFHRVIPGFMIQGGDPLGNGSGGPGYAFKNEYSDLRFDRPGRLAMANAGLDTNGSQFFITVSKTPLYQLDGKYTIFGQCGNLDVVNAIADAPKTMNFASGENSTPLHPVRIKTLTIIPAHHLSPTAAKPKSATPATRSTPATKSPATHK